MQKRLFSELGLSEPILKAVEKLGFEQTSPIQSAAIPVMMAGRDMVGQSATGSGKTAAFGIPAIERVSDTDRKVQVLVLTPTRELATQVAEEFARLSFFRPKVHAVPIYGGASYDRQFSELRKGPQIVIGTPGRVIDHIQRNTLDLSEVKMAVLDECDRMLDMGFREDMERILSATPKERQTVFFSATLPPAIRRLIEEFSKNPEHVMIESKAMTVPTVEQVYFDVPPRAKLDALTRLIDVHDARLSIVFANTQRTVDDVADALIARGYSADRLHGGMSQVLRTRTMAKFKSSGFDVLVATDVAGRGIDVDDLDLVINFDLPYDPEDYVHRIGRTGRFGRSGVALSLISGREVYRIQGIERFTRQRIRHGYVPTWDQVEEKRMSGVLDKIRSAIESGDHAPQAVYIDRLLDEGLPATDLASAMLHLLLAAEGIEATKPASGDPFARKDAAPVRAPVAAPVKPVAAAKTAAKPVKESPKPAPAAAKPVPAVKPAPLPAAVKPEPLVKIPAPAKPIVEPAPEVPEPAEEVIATEPAAVAPAPVIAEAIEEVVAPEPEIIEPQTEISESTPQAPAAFANKGKEERPAAKSPAVPSARIPKADRPAKPAPKPAENYKDESPRRAVPDKPAQSVQPAQKDSIRSDAAARHLPAPASGYRWITMNVGKNDGVLPRDVVDAITEGADVPGKAVGLIKIHDTETDVQVLAANAAGIVESLDGGNFEGKKVRVHFPRTKDSPFASRPGKFAGKPGKFAGRPRSYGHPVREGAPGRPAGPRDDRGMPARPDRPRPAGSSYERRDDTRGPNRPPVRGPSQKRSPGRW